MTYLNLVNEFELKGYLHNSFIYPCKDRYLCCNRVPQKHYDTSNCAEIIVLDRDFRRLSSQILTFDIGDVYDLRIFEGSRSKILTVSTNIYGEEKPKKAINFNTFFYKIKIRDDFTIEIKDFLFSSLEKIGRCKNQIVYNNILFFDFSCQRLLNLETLEEIYCGKTKYPKLRGGSNIIDLGDELLTFCHDFKMVKGKRLYRGFIVKLERVFPYRIREINLMNVNPNKYGEIPVKTYPEFQFFKMLRSVVFPISCWQTNDSVFVSIGVNEVKTIVQEYIKK